MLEIKNISKTFNPNTINENKVINGLNLTLEDNDFVTVIGGNGAGKSTLLNLISGSVSADAGTIVVDDINLTKLKEHQRAKYIARVFQDPHTGTCSELSIEENLSLASRRGRLRTLKRGITKDEKVKYKELLSKLNLGLEDRMSAKVGLLSGGQRQAVTLLMTTLVKPKILLLDEHTAALDPKTANTVLELTDEIVKDLKVTTIMITHNMKDAIKYGNRLVMMSKGKVVLDIKGEEKKKLTVPLLLEQFEKVTGSEDSLSDAAILG